MTGARIDRPARRRLGVGAAIVLVLVAAAIAVVVGIVRSAVPEPAGVAVVAGSPVAEPPAVYVHVFGAVQAPGLYRLDDGARVVDVIAAAGGMTADADESAVNLARRVVDGEQLHVPAVGEEPPAADTQPGIAADGRVNLNTADEAALDTLPRIGPAIAARIIEWRDAHGAFTSIDDLLAVPGIGEKMLAGLRDLVTV